MRNQLTTRSKSAWLHEKSHAPQAVKLQSSCRRCGLDVSAIDTKTLNGINVTIAFFILNHPHPEMDTESFCVGLWDMGVTYCCYNKRYMKYTMGGQKKVAPHYNTVVVYKRQKVPKQFRNIHGAVQINSK